MPRRSILLFAAACAVIAVALIAVTLVIVSRSPVAPRPGEVLASGQPDVGGTFQLTDHDGRAVDQSMLEGKWSLVFFGFTYCPDFCPTTLAAENLQIVFISVDPERDTPQALKDYLSTDGFPEGVIGLTGTPEQVRAAADAYRAYYQKVGEGEGYTMNHSLTVYLMGPDGKFRTTVAGELGPERSAAIIEQAMARG